MQSLLVLAFRDTVAERVAANLRTSTKKILLESNKEWLERFVAETDFAAYDFVLALGEYSGQDRSKLRIETTCNSQFRNNKQNLQTLAIHYFLNPKPPFKLGKGMGNSWCNLLCYLMTCNMCVKQFTFVHIPKIFDASLAADQVDRQLNFVVNTTLKPHTTPH